MKKLLDFIGSTSIIWIPIVGVAVASKLAEVISVEMIMKTIGIMAIITTILLLKGDIKKCLEERK